MQSAHLVTWSTEWYSQTKFKNLTRTDCGTSQSCAYICVHKTYRLQIDKMFEKKKFLGEIRQISLLLFRKFERIN